MAIEQLKNILSEFKGECPLTPPVKVDEQIIPSFTLIPPVKAVKVVLATELKIPSFTLIPPNKAVQIVPNTDMKISSFNLIPPVRVVLPPSPSLSSSAPSV